MFTRRTVNVAFLALVVPASADGQTELRWKFAEGKKHQFAVTQNMETTAKVMEQNIDTTLTQVIDMTWAVQKVMSDGSARMTQTVDRMQMTVKGPAGEMKFDSKDPDAASPALAQLKTITDALIGEPIELTMTSLGDVKDVKVPKKLTDAAKDAGPAGSMLTEDGVKNIATQGSLSFPEKALKDGDGWKKAQTLDMPGVGKMTIDTAYTFRGAAEGAQKIDADLDVKIENSGLGLSIKSQKCGATFFFDNDAGVLRRSEVTQQMTMGGQIMGQEFSQDIKTKVTMKLAQPSASPSK
jgi:hypothetical protein